MAGQEKPKAETEVEANPNEPEEYGRFMDLLRNVIRKPKAKWPKRAPRQPSDRDTK